MSDDQPQKSPAAEARSGITSRFAAAGMPTERSKDFGGTAKRLFAMMGDDRPWAIMVVALSVLSVTCMVLGPWLLGRSTNVIIDGLMAGTGVDMGRLGKLLAIALVLYLTGASLAYFQARLLARLVQHTMFNLRSAAEDQLNRLPLRYVDSQPRGDMLSRVTNDVDNVQQSLQQTLSQVLTSSLTIIGVVIMMFVISPLLALIALITIPTSLFAMRFITSRSKGRFLAQWAHTGNLNAQVEENFTGHSLVKVFGQTEEVERRFDAENDDLYVASFWAQFISGTIQPMMMFFGNLNFVAIAVIGGIQVANGNMTIGAIQAFIQYSRQFTQPLTQLASMVNVLQSGIASAERVFELLDAPDQRPDPVDPVVDFDPRGRVDFDHVAFSYVEDQPLITDLSLVADPGETVAIVGPTGAGKTTLVNLLMRFYEIDSGRIALDGISTADMTRDGVRSQMGMVLQDTWLFSGSIRDNIAYGNLDATDEQVLEAARATYVDRFVRSLPDGYDTMVEDDRGSLSAGEKQLVTIARAFLADPTILILDEATSSVDTRTEVLIQHAMAALRSNRTSFVIAHRLSTIRDADTILVMEAGNIVEQGDHDELLAADGAYARLYRSQFEAPAIDVA